MSTNGVEVASAAAPLAARSAGGFTRTARTRVALICAAALFVSACGSSSGDAPATPPPPAGTPAAPPAGTPAPPPAGTPTPPPAGTPTPPPPAPTPAPAPGVATRLQISPPGGMIPIGERRAFTVRAFDANGTEVALPSDLGVFNYGDFEATRTPTGFELRALGTAAANVFVRSGTLESSRALFYSAEIAPGAVMVSDAQVLAAPEPVNPNAVRGVGFRYRATLAGVGLPAAGTLMIGSGTQPLAGRVVSASPNPLVPADTDVVLELVPLTTLFSKVAMRINYDPDEIKALMVAAPARQVIASADRVRRMNVPGAVCKGDGPALGVLTGELEAKVDPRLRFRMEIDVENSQVNSMVFAAGGGIDVTGKAVINLGASLTGGVTCKAMFGYVPIPLTGPLSPFFAPVIPLEGKFELGAQISVNAFSFSAEFKQSADMDFGFQYNASADAQVQLQPIKRVAFSDPELNRSVTFPNQAGVRVKATTFLGLSSGLALGGVLGRLDVVEVYAGPEFEAKFGGSYDVANDAVYTAEYELKGKAGIGPGEHIQNFFEKILLSPKAIDLSAKLEKSIARTALPYEVAADRETFRAGDEVTFNVMLNPATVNFPLVGYNVSEVRIYRLTHGPSFTAQQIATAAATDGQTRFTLKWTADMAGELEYPSGNPTFYAFVVDKPLAAISGLFPFELGRVRGKIAPPLYKTAGTGTAAYAIDNGVLRAIGKNNGGALGAGLPIGAVSTGPVTVPLTDVRSITGSAWHATALLADGSVYSWGWGPDIGIRGGDPLNNPLPLPVGVSGSSTENLTGVVSISSGYSNSVAVKGEDGSVWQFGSSGLARRINGIAGVASAAQGGGHVLFLTPDGKVLAWGGNTSGALGDGSYISKLSPVAVPGLENVIAIAAGGGHSMALKKDGTVWVWGSNFFGQLGLGTDVAAVNVPTQVPGLVGVSRISSGEAHSMALANGVVYVWGRANGGEIGNGCPTLDPVRSPVPVMTGAIDIDGGEFMSMAVVAGGGVMAWGTVPGLSLGCTPAGVGLTAR